MDLILNLLNPQIECVTKFRGKLKINIFQLFQILRFDLTKMYCKIFLKPCMNNAQNFPLAQPRNQIKTNRHQRLHLDSCQSQSEKDQWTLLKNI